MGARRPTGRGRRGGPGDPDRIARNIEVYERLGFDQFMCLVQFSDISHRESLRTIELIGKHVIPRFAGR